MGKHILTKEDSIKGGKTSKRPSFDASLRELISEYLEDKDPTEGNRKAAMVRAAFDQFLQGNYKPLSYLIDRGWGTSKQTVLNTFKEESPLKIKFED